MGSSAKMTAGLFAKVRARATIAGVPRWQMREISGGNGIGQNSLIAHFGLGNATNAQTVRIEWPSGIVQELTNVAAKQLMTVIEPPLLQATLTNGNFQLLVTDTIGSTSGIEASIDLTGWTSLGIVTNTSRTVRFADPASATDQKRFYRAVSKQGIASRN